MDDIVRAALKKWPNVPDCYDWLALDARGDWFMRDDRIQAAGPFPLVKGSRIEHDKLKEFIQRNCDHDERGAWFFQNGPQRVYLTLEAAPWVWGVRRGDAGFELDAHTGAVVGQVHHTFVDEFGRLFLETDLGLGVLRPMDMDVAADALLAGVWPEPEEVDFATLPTRFGYVIRPVKA